MTAPRKLTVCFSLDVEEEGLFSGNYASRNLSVKNVQCLKRLVPICKEFSVPMTLFCSWPVFQDADSRCCLDYLRAQCEVEIGAHLHYWCNPPFREQQNGKKPNAGAVPAELLEEKLVALLDAGKRVTGKDIISFRMGRWDLRRLLLPILAKNGIKVDSSICPLRFFYNGPDHFLAPHEPYWVKLAAGGRILEAPVTQIPVFSALAAWWRKAFAFSSGVLDSFHFFGALSANPVWHRLPIMKMATCKAASEKGILIFFIHSSELMPGASPNVPTQEAADALFARLDKFLRWLRDNFQLQALTTSKLTAMPLSESFPILPAPQHGDW